MKIKAFPFIVEAARRGGKSGARLVYKTEGGATARAFAPFNAYFYLLPEGDASAAEKRAIKLKATVRKGEATVTRVERVKLKLGFEEKLFLKVYASAPEHVPRLRDEAKALGETFEYRIPFTKRFAIDTGLVPNEAHELEIDSGEISSIKRVDRKEMPGLRVMSFDIETYNPAGMPRSDKDAIIMISYATLKDGKPVGRVLSWKKSKHEFVEQFKDEKSMVAGFIERVRQEKVDVLTGYNSDEFDLPYLVERCKKLKLAFDVGRDKRPVSFKQIGLRKRARVSGRVHFDAFNAIALLNKVGANKFSRLSLGVVYSELLGRKKPEVKKLEIWRAWDNGGKALEELFDYSRSDAIACLEISGYVLPMELELSRITGLPLFEASRASASEMVEALLMRRAFERKEIVPKKPSYAVVEQRLRQPIEGAFVKVPEPGVYDDIAVFDFRSLYPSIIVSHNIDPATIGSNEEDAFESPTGARFSKRRGIVPETLERVLDERIEAKKRMANAKPADKPALNGRQIALKILANSFYGYLAYARSRYYSRECGESTTAWARKYIHETIGKAEKAGFKVLYSDTDSCFLLLGDKTKNDALAFQAGVNASLPGRMELELEDFYPRGIFVSKKQGEKGAKKKYALLNGKGEIKIRGFELVRRDWSPIARDTQREVLEILLKSGDVGRVKELVARRIDELKSGKTPLAQLAVRTQLRKKAGNYGIVSPEVSAVKKARNVGVDVAEHSLIEYVITKQGKSISEKASLLELVKEGDYDADYYVNNQLLPAVLKLLGSLGTDADDLKAKGKQKGLMDF